MSRILNARVRRLMMPALLLVALLFAIRLVGQPTVAEAATPHRAAVIVDTGASVYRVVITFTEDSITGIDALQRANADPVVYTFNGQGGAVCRIFGVGRDAGPGCLGGQDGDSRYWAYFKAPAGTSSFKYSTVGAGQAKVHDGDVEGWRFGTGAAPEFVSLQSLAPPPQGPDLTSPPVQAPVTPAADGSNRSSGPAARGSQGLADAATSVSTLPVTGATGSPAAATGPAAASGNESATRRERGADEKRTAKNQDTTEAALASSSKDDSSSAASLIWFGALIAVIVVAIVVARRSRRRPERST